MRDWPPDDTQNRAIRRPSVQTDGTLSIAQGSEAATAINHRTAAKPGHKRSEELAEEIARQIAANVLQPGDRLPSIRQTCRTRHLSPSTVFQAYDLLENRGLEAVARSATGLPSQSSESFAMSPNSRKSLPGRRKPTTWTVPSVSRIEITSMLTSSRCCSVRAGGSPCLPNVMSAGSTISIPVAATTWATRSLSRSDSAFAPCRTL